jgi:hypothetical protein
MTPTINPKELKAAAEHLEWVLRQYPNEPTVQGLLHSLLPLIEDAKAGRVAEPVGRQDIPGGYDLADGAYIPYKNPDVGEAYSLFVTEMKGGLTEQERRILDRIEAIQQAITKPGGKS